MARTKIAAATWAFFLVAGAVVSADEGAIVLREAPKVGDTTSVLVEMKAEGKSYHESPDGDPKARPKPSPMKVSSRLEFAERVLQPGDDGRAKRTVRRVLEGLTAVAGKPDLVRFRPEVALLIADRREAGVVVVSPSGPLTRWEMELAQAPGDPLAMTGLLPAKPVREGDRWPAAVEAAKALCDYDSVSSNGLEAKLETADAASARVRVGGEVKGVVRGAEGTINVSGWFTFDRKLGRIDRAELTRVESRKPGPVELGLEVTSTLTVERTAVASPAGLGDDVLASLPQDADPRREWLLLAPPSSRYTVEHDRDWHLTYEDPKQVVLKRLEGGSMVAHGRIAVGPNAGRGGHLDAEVFREDVRKVLGERFGEVVEASESVGGPGENYIYKVSASGHERDLAVLWYYYLIAGPDGDQLLATFTLERAAEKRFGDADRRLVETIAWKPAPARPR